MEMERGVAKILAVLMLVLIAASNGEGRRVKEEKADVVEVEQPQNYVGGFGTSGGFVPAPGGGVAFVPGPTVFCSVPGTGCVRLQPTIPAAGSAGTGTGTGTGTPP